MLQNTDGAKRKGQSRETRNIRYTGQINVGEYRRGDKKELSRETDSIGYTKHRTNKCYSIPTGLKEKDNPEKRAT